MPVSFGDFKPNEIYNLIENKGPIRSKIVDIQGHNTQQTEEFDAILCYIKMASTLKMANTNNNADSNPEPEDTTSKDNTTFSCKLSKYK